MFVLYLIKNKKNCRERL